MKQLLFSLPFLSSSAVGLLSTEAEEMNGAGVGNRQENLRPARPDKGTINSGDGEIKGLIRAQSS